MTTRRFIALCALCAMVFLAVSMFAGLADAQDSTATKKVDKDRATKRGVADSLASGKPDDGDGKSPTKLQMGVGLGSFVVAFIVVKWL